MRPWLNPSPCNRQFGFQRICFRGRFEISARDEIRHVIGPLKLERVVNKYAPLKIVSKRKAKQLSKLWITRGIRIAFRKKNEFYYSGDMVKYKLCTNKILTLSRVSKKLYYHNYFETNRSNIKNTWKGINLLINGKTRGDHVMPWEWRAIT